jgi:hypothetical protein
LNSTDMQALIADELVNFANSLADSNPDADYWDIADGILSGAVHWWLYANAPCGDPTCTDCESISTAERRMETLRKLVADMAESSEYYHSPNDENVAHA